jgi:hypothetical protein
MRTGTGSPSWRAGTTSMSDTGRRSSCVVGSSSPWDARRASPCLRGLTTRAGRRDGEGNHPGDADCGQREAAGRLLALLLLDHGCMLERSNQEFDILAVEGGHDGLDRGCDGLTVGRSQPRPQPQRSELGDAEQFLCDLFDSRTWRQAVGVVIALRPRVRGSPRALGARRSWQRDLLVEEGHRLPRALRQRRKRHQLGPDLMQFGLGLCLLRRDASQVGFQLGNAALVGDARDAPVQQIGNRSARVPVASQNTNVGAEQDSLPRTIRLR